MKIYLATWLYEPAQGRALTVAKKKSRLLSYFHTRNCEKQLKTYVKTGMNEK
jgi:hypothetical protein